MRTDQQHEHETAPLQTVCFIDCLNAQSQGMSQGKSQNLTNPRTYHAQLHFSPSLSELPCRVTSLNRQPAELC